jgi:outer membrane protein TolC
LKAPQPDANNWLPSLSVSAGYTQLSPEPSGSTSGVPAQYAGLVNSLLDMFSGAPSNSRDVRLDLQYTIFAGLRLREAADIARLQAQGKTSALEIARRALAFEIRRAYWEAYRAAANEETLEKDLELESVLREEMNSLVEQGMAAVADQAALALDDAKSMRDLAFLGLSALTGDDSGAQGAILKTYHLISKPGPAFP